MTQDGKRPLTLKTRSSTTLMMPGATYLPRSKDGNGERERGNAVKAYTGKLLTIFRSCHWLHFQFPRDFSIPCCSRFASAWDSGTLRSVQVKQPRTCQHCSAYCALHQHSFELVPTPKS